MILNRSLIAVVGMSSCLVASAGAMNLLTNPSFENGAGGATFSATTDFGGATALELTSISTEIPGWRWEQNGGGGAAWLEDNSDFFGSDGDHLLYLDANQSIQWDDGVTVIANGLYQFDYNFAAWERGQDNSPASSGDSTALLEYNYRDTGGDIQFGTYTGPGDIVAPANDSNPPGSLTWINGSWQFTVPADYGSDFNFQINVTGGMLLDDLSISEVPEPGSASLLGLALGTLLLRRSRRR